jgi:imidazolonepropionase-like amidohydrolase
MAAPRKWALVNANLIDGDPGGYAGRGGLVVEDGRIVASGPDVSVDSIGEVEFVDAGGWSVLPGLIDCHAHLTWNALASPVATLIEERASPARLVLRAAANAQSALARGSTTVRDLGSPNEVIFPLRDAIRDGICPGPRLLAAGYVITTPTGHCHYVGQHATDAVSAREAVGRQIESGADVIKVMTSGGLHTPGSDPASPQFTLESLRTIVEMAHAAGRRVTGHATCDAAIALAVEAGLDSIQHGTNVELATARAVAQRNVWVTPTLDTRYFLDMHLDDPAIPEVIRARAAAATGQDRSVAYRNTLEAGVTVTAGTDSGTTFVPHGALATEIRLMHEGGLPTRQALASATWLAATEVALPGVIGTLSRGAFADLLVLEGDPLQDLTALEAVAVVIQAGVPVPGTSSHSAASSFAAWSNS